MTKQVPDSYVVESKAARELAANMPKDDQLDSFACMRQVMEEKAQALITVDSSFVIALACLQHAEGALEETVEQKVNARMPSLEKHVAIADARFKLRELLGSVTVKRSSRATIGQV